MREEYGVATADELDKRKSFGRRFYAHSTRLAPIKSVMS